MKKEFTLRESEAIYAAIDLVGFEYFKQEFDKGRSVEDIKGEMLNNQALKETLARQIVALAKSNLK